MGITIGLMFCYFSAGLLIGLCLGYFRLAQWYQQKTGKSLWQEVKRYG